MAIRVRTNQQNAADLAYRPTSVATRHSHQARLVSLLSLLHRFKEWRHTVERLGYRSYWAVLRSTSGRLLPTGRKNARDYGILEALGPVPQNRERLFMVSVREDLCPGAPYPFPNPMPLTRTIADVLDPDVPSSFFLKPESVVSFLTRNENGDHCLYRVTDHLPTAEEIREWVREEGHTLS